MHLRSCSYTGNVQQYNNYKVVKSTPSGKPTLESCGLQEVEISCRGGMKTKQNRVFSLCYKSVRD